MSVSFALSTRWNAGRHHCGEELIDEILGLGFEEVELGYNLRLDLVPGVLARLVEGAVRVGSVHNFCPVPVGAPRGHPELFTFADRDPRVRESALIHTRRTIEFAAEVGARTVVSHAGNVDMDRLSQKLGDLLQRGEHYSPAYEKIKLKLQIQREKKAAKQLPYLYDSLEKLLPDLERHGIVLALENLPTWEAFPTEVEMVALLRHFAGRPIRYWHDLGHGQIRQNLGLINHERWLERLAPHLAGMHIHDVAPPLTDHVMPPRGQIDFSRIKPYGTLPVHRVIEPSSRTAPEDLAAAHEFLKEAWGASAPEAPEATNAKEPT